MEARNRTSVRLKFAIPAFLVMVSYGLFDATIADLTRVSIAPDNMNQHYRAHARKLGLEVVPQTAPPKNAVSEEASDEDDDDDDDDFEAPPSRSGTASRPRAGGAVKDDAYYDESHSPSGYGSPIMYGGQQPT